jgi:hypothetical protein
VRSFAENSERKARDSKDEEADPSRERQTGIRGLFCALVLSLSQIELLCSKIILSIEFLSSAQNALREEE